MTNNEWMILARQYGIDRVRKALRMNFKTDKEVIDYLDNPVEQFSYELDKTFKTHK